MADHLSEQLAAQIGHLKDTLPPHSELARLIGSLDDPASDEASKDRYVAIVAANAVEGALRIMLGALDPQHIPTKKMTFSQRIERSHVLGIITPGQALVLHRVREIRNAFAHALAPVSFCTPVIVEITALLWDHPVNDWASYFSPIFPPRHRFALVCGTFVAHLQPRTSLPA